MARYLLMHRATFGAVLLLVVGGGAGAADIEEPRDLSGVWWGGPSATPYRLEIVGEGPVLTAEGEAGYEASRELKASIDEAMDNPFDVAKCTLVGVPRIWAQPFPFEITQKPELTVIIYEHMHSFRNIVMDQAPYTLDNALALNRNGSSVGRWEEDTLIIESTAFNPLGMVDEAGLPQTEALRVVERLRKLDDDTLEVVATMEDGAYYVRPWTVRATYTRRPDVRLAEYVCGYGHFEHRYTNAQ